MHPSGNYYGRPHPYVSIPAGAQPPRNPGQFTPKSAPHVFGMATPPLDSPSTPLDLDSAPDTARPRPMPDFPPRPRNRTASVVESGSQLLVAESDLYRSSSQRASSHSPAGPRQQPTRGDMSLGMNRMQSDYSTTSFASEEYYDPDDYPAESMDDLSRELSNLSLTSDEALRRFQEGELPESDQQWHRLVPFEAREALGKQEVQRQSVIFEVFTSEREYVSDLEAVKEVYIEPLRNASPPIIAEDHFQGFISDVFWNMDQILVHHQRMLSNFVERQREQHPLIQSVADIVLDALLIFRDEYESYIKHYPISEAVHRAELKRNPKYEIFMQNCSQNPRIRKRDLITFLSRPVSRLPRFGLVLEHILKLTDPEHPDCETLPLILGILSEFIKSTQPGIAVSESKVKLWDLCESLVFVKGEITDMDLYDESRTLVHIGPLARRQRSETDWYGWSDLTVALLDHYLLLTREETRPNGVVKRHVVSRPLPLEYVRLGVFDGPPESRKERADDGRLLESLRFVSRQMFPFTVYHASSKSNRRYTLYASNESGRKKWYDSLVDAIGVHQVRSESNMYYEPQTLSNRFFPVVGTRVAYNSINQFTGKVISGVPFSSGGKSFLAISCVLGIFVVKRGEESFRKALNLPNPAYMVVLEKFNKFIVLHDSSLLSYSLDLLARVGLGLSPPQMLEASLEKISGNDGHVLFFRAGRIGGRTLIIYASKSFLQITLHALEAFDRTDLHLTPTRSTSPTSGAYRSFRSFGTPSYVPKDAYDVIPLVKTIAITTEKGIIIVDPTDLSKATVPLVPDFNFASTNPAMALLKSRCETAKPLGLVRCDNAELLVVYDVLGCYITKHGAPGRSCGYIRWETKATSYAHRGAHVLLFSPQFIEVRHVNTGRLDQVIEANDIRLLHCGPLSSSDSVILAVMTGEREDRDEPTEKIVELQETALITQRPTASTNPSTGDGLWDEWDMS